MENTNINQITEIILENSTNVHKMQGKSLRIVESLETMNTKVIEAAKGAVVLHGEHGVIVTENKHIVKINQQEYNPVLKAVQNAMD